MDKSEKSSKSFDNFLPIFGPIATIAIKCSLSKKLVGKFDWTLFFNSDHCARKDMLERLSFHNMKIVKNEWTLVSLLRITTKKIHCPVNNYVNMA